MEMVAAARLRRAEQRIEALRPYAGAIRKVTRQVADAAGGSVSRVPVLEGRDEIKTVGYRLVTGDRGLAGAFNYQSVREGLRLRDEFNSEGTEVVFYVVGRRGNSTLRFRGENVIDAFEGFTDRPAFANAREIGSKLTTGYIDRDLDRVELIYNRYVSPLTQYVRRHTLLPLQEAEVFGAGIEDEEADEDAELVTAHQRALWIYEPDPEEALARLFAEYVDISVFRALLESTASEHGSRMIAMRNAAENAQEMIGDLTLEMNRARQAEITQEILEVVAGAEALG